MKLHSNQFTAWGCFFLSFAAILITGVLLAPKTLANTYPQSPGGSNHQAISAKAGDWSPGKYSNGSFIPGTGDHNCKFPEIYPPGSGRPDQDAGACVTGLEFAAETRYKLFSRNANHPDGSTIPVLALTLTGACRDVTPYNGHPNGYPSTKSNHPDKGARKIKVEIRETQPDGSKGALRTTTYNFAEGTNNPNNRNANCGGANDNDLIVTIPQNAWSLNQSRKFGNKVSTAMVVVYKYNHPSNATPGNKLFKLQFDNGPSSGVYGDEDAFFALGSANIGGHTTYFRTIRVDCSYRSGSMTFRFRDVDWGSANQGGVRPYISLSNESQGIVFDLRYGTHGTQKNFNYTVPANLVKWFREYTISYGGVADSNGIIFGLPYSEFKGYGQNDCPPDSGIGTVSCDAIRGWFFYPNNREYKNFRARIQWRHNSNDDWKDFPDDTGVKQPHLDADFGTSPRPNGSDGNQFRVTPEGLRGIFIGDNTLDFRLNVRDAVSNELFQQTALKLNVTKDDCGDQIRAADCHINSPQMVPGRPNSVIAGRDFTLTGTFTPRSNSVPLYVGILPGSEVKSPLATNWHNYGITYNAGNGSWPYFPNTAGQWADGGDSVPVSITLRAPDNPQSKFYEFLADHFGYGAAGGFQRSNCNITLDVYEEYEFRPEASQPQGDVENPSAVRYTSTVTQISPISPSKPILGTSYRALHLDRNGADTQVHGPIADGERNYRDTSSHTETYNPPNAQFGDKYCSVTYMQIGTGNTGNVGITALGYKAPNGAIIPVRDGSASSCYRVENRPYVRAYGGDVAAGGGFENIAGDSCGATDSKILAFLRPLSEQRPGGTKSGSGGQLAAMALGDISGFTSASIRNNAPLSSRGLTFANNQPTNVSEDSLDPPLGGNMSGAGNGWCVPDFFQSTQFPDGESKDASTSSGAINVNGSLRRDGQTVRSITNGNSAGKLTLTSNSTPSNNVDYTNRHTVYVDGDVFINNDIRYNTDFGSGTDGIPSFTLVVRGNIYIQNSVTQLDGLYIAQPAEGRDNTGRIYTCANAAGNAITVGTDIFSSCSSHRLMVNGAFIAQRVMLNRTIDTLRDSAFRERANTSRAAEIFNFSPEIYLSPPVFRPNSTPTSGDYDYISILAPTL